MYWFIYRLNSIFLSSLSAGLLNITTALDLSLYLQREREYVPWAAFFYAFKPFSNRLSLSAVNGEKEVCSYNVWVQSCHYFLLAVYFFPNQQYFA